MHDVLNKQFLPNPEKMAQISLVVFKKKNAKPLNSDILQPNEENSYEDIYLSK